ncbi:hypothetical protein RCL1_004451 [Eukaryota sp. TZLM3-RCL]
MDEDIPLTFEQIEIEPETIPDTHYTQAQTSSSAPVSSASSKKRFPWLLNAQSTSYVDEDEPPLLEELDINVTDIYHKIRLILLPFKHSFSDRSHLVSSPDFWGPLLIVTMYGVLCFFKHFAAITWTFLLWFLGSFIIFFVTRVLGSEVSFSSTLGLVGYSVLPMIITLILSFISPQVFSVLYAVLGISWSSYSVSNLLIQNASENKKWMIVYPASLVFVFIFRLRYGV